MLGAMDFGVADYGQRAGGEQAAQIAIALFADTAELFPAPLECCFGTRPIQAEKSRPDRKAFGSVMLATHLRDRPSGRRSPNGRGVPISALSRCNTQRLAFKAANNASNVPTRA